MSLVAETLANNMSRISNGLMGFLFALMVDELEAAEKGLNETMELTDHVLSALEADDGSLAASVREVLKGSNIAASMEKSAEKYRNGESADDEITELMGAEDALDELKAMLPELTKTIENVQKIAAILY